MRGGALRRVRAPQHCPGSGTANPPADGPVSDHISLPRIIPNHLRFYKKWERFGHEILNFQQRGKHLETVLRAVVYSTQLEVEMSRELLPQSGFCG